MKAFVFSAREGTKLRKTFPTLAGAKAWRATTISYKLTVAPKGGFTGSVAMNAAGIPSAASGSWSTQSVSITSTTAGTATYTLRIPSTQRPAPTPSTFSGTGGSLEHAAMATITIS